MQIGQKKIKEFFTAKKEKISNQIEKTPIEKFFLLFLIVITISAAVLGYLQFKKNIQSPLYYSYLERKRGELRLEYNLLNLNVNTLNQGEILQLQNQDSDLDGIDDYSEIYIYKTNPYLEDSDNDGYWDRDEIVTGTDPNCASGQSCQTAASAGEQTTTTESPSSSADIISEQLDALGNTNLSTGTDIGADYQIFLDSLVNMQSGNSNINADDKAQMKASFKNMTPAQVRELLVQAGMDQAVLDQIDDQTIMDYFLQTLDKI